jgi:multiple sugar transport system substrate-binding protein
MVWDEVIELGKRVTRLDGGVQYVGLGIGAPGKIREQNMLSLIGKDGKVDLSNPLFSRIFDLWKRTYSEINQGKNGTNVFVKDKIMAMFAGNIRTTLLENATRQKDELPNWDMVSYPYFKGQPFVSPTTRGVYAVASTSGNPDAAMELIDALLSKEVADTIMDQFMNPELEKKNIKALEMPENTFLPDKYDSIGANLLGKKLNQMTKENLDVNTTLRQLQDEMQKAYDEAKSTGQ